MWDGSLTELRVSRAIAGQCGKLKNQPHGHIMIQRNHLRKAENSHLKVGDDERLES